MSQASLNRAETHTTPAPASRAAGRDHDRVSYLVEEGYISFEQTTIPVSAIPTKQYADARRAVDHSRTVNPLHADLKAIATWYLWDRTAFQVDYEVRYPRDGRVADAAIPAASTYVEVGHIQDFRRIYQLLGYDLQLEGTTISSVLQRYPATDDPREQVCRILWIPFPATTPNARAWDAEEIAVYSYSRGPVEPLVANRSNGFW